MRERYETEEDRKREQETATIIEGVTDQLAPILKCVSSPMYPNVPGKITFKKLPELTYKIDWCILNQFSKNNRDHIEAWAELKTRKMFYGQYDDVMISSHKMVAGMQISHYTRLPFIVFIRFTDGIGYHSVDINKEYEIVHGGRITQTRDAADIEPVHYIKTEDFTLIKPLAVPSKDSLLDI